MKQVKHILRITVLAVTAFALGGCAEKGNQALTGLATEIIGFTTFAGVAVAIFTFMLAAFNLIVARATNSSRNISENVKTYILVGIMLAGLLLAPRLVGFAVESFQGTTRSQVDALNKVWGGQ